ncbi:MAG TPA: MGMT family protein [Ferruginibacter sp.]|nr:MGMT family protein [Ferruginibacter sp.]HRN80574.1 MGMT family protein [Ferruginibacter sp.]HRO18125.1 MGMT family protein [Ferruginibacter sp.]HRQ21524.1 MGMT family protein [Ferruginibacter sp.]
MKKNPTPTIPEKHRDFFSDVYDVVRQIPKGRVTSYGAIAAFLGTRSSSRMVGWAMNAAHGRIPPVPAHRVVNRKGLLTGRMHFSPPEQMEQLLAAEGVEIKEHTVQHFDKHFWDPAKELQL